MFFLKRWVSKHDWSMLMFERRPSQPQRRAFRAVRPMFDPRNPATFDDPSAAIPTMNAWLFMMFYLSRHGLEKYYILKLVMPNC